MTTPARLTERETLARYEKRGALLRGHFRLTSGLHSDVYLQSALVLQHPEDAAALGEALAAAFSGKGAPSEGSPLPLRGPGAPSEGSPLPLRVQAVVAPAIGGILVAHEVARALGVRALFTERENGVMRLRRGFTLSPGERCLVVEDVITTGGSTREVVQCVEALGGVVVGVGSLIDRSGGAAAFTVRHVALATVSAATYQPDACPLCQAGSVAVKPGSRA
ncbi:MAG TPA: phosphoribosyltransferase family protein [Candidatus Binatia bacterium]|nr:phosphoribosyltransferase family protein [Candidatus Binatia bacterium]